MKRMAVLVCAVAAALTGAAQVTNGVWQGTGSPALWSDSANWVDGDVASGGGSATFIAGGVATTVSNDLPDLVVGDMTFSGANWTFRSDEPITFAGGADTTNTLSVLTDNVIDFPFTIGAGESTLHLTGGGYINISATNQAFTGRWLVSNNRLELKTGTSLRAEPSSLIPDALTLDGADIKNNDSSIVFPPTMGITLGPGGGAFGIGWSENHRITLGSPITGPGQLKIARNNGIILLANDRNNYEGGTLIGVNTKSGYIAAGPPASNVAYLQLAADGVLPYGPGKGGLRIEGGAGRGLLDTAGSSNRVSTLELADGGALTNSVPGTGMIVADGGSLAGRFSPGARVTWTGKEPLTLAMADGNGGGEIAFHATVTLTEPLALGGSDLLLDGATLNLPAGQTALTSNSGILRVGANGATITLLNGGSAITLSGGLTLHENASLTSNVPFTVGSDTAIPAYFDADTAIAVTFRGRVWINRLPATWSVEPGATVTLSGSAISELETFASLGATVRIAPESLGDLPDPFPIDSGSTFWLDTATQTGGHINNASGNTLTLTTGIALSGGGTLGLAGVGTTTVSGAITGSGNILKADSGTAILDGANIFNGTVTVSNGTLVANSTAALGANGNAVTVAGGHLGNAQGAALAIAQPVTVTAGGFTVNGGSISFSGGITLTTGTLDKRGDGDLILDAATLTAPAGLNLTGGAVIYTVASGTTAELTSLKGSGDLILRGGGTLILSADPAYTGRLVMEEGILLKAEAPAEAPTLWLDASAAASLHFDGSGGIVRWNDARDGLTGTAYPYAYLNREAPNYSSTVGVPLSDGTFQTATPPTLLLNALAGKPVVDFGRYLSGSWLEVTPVPNTRTIFWILGSQQGGGYLIGVVGMGTARNANNVDNGIGAGDALWNNNSWNGNTFRESQNWINGVSVTGTSKGLSGGYDQISTILPPPSNIVIRALAKEGRLLQNVNNRGRSGGQRLAEFIVYDRELTEPERLATEAYLKRKWQSGAAKEPSLHVTGHGTVSLPPAGATVTVPQITGNGTLTQTGAGTLIAESPESFSGTFELSEGTFSADGFAAQLTKDASPVNPVPGAAFWVDATVLDSFGKDENDRMFWRDARWNDGTGTDYIVATQRWTVAPTIISNAVGTLPVIDMGPTNTLAGMQWSTELPNARTIFWLLGSQQGGGILMGSGDGDPGIFNRGVNSAPPSTPIYHSSYAHEYVRHGVTRIDGIQVNGTVTGLSGGYQVITVLTTNDVIVGKFAHDREPPLATSGRHGGQRLGEVIVYTNALSDTQIRAVEAYLMTKWQRTGTRDVPATLAHLDAPAESDPSADGVLSVDARQLNVSQLTGTGHLLKTGGATLSLGMISGYSGQLTVEGGRALLNGSVPRTPTFWVDANSPGSIVYDPQTMEISRWNDCRANGMYAEFRIVNTTGGTTGKSEFPPTFLSADGDLSGKPAVDLGAWTSNQHLSWSKPLTGIRTVFWVLGSQAGGGLLLSFDRDTSTRHFFRAGGGVNESDYLDITRSNPIWSSLWPYGPVNNGQTRLNGVTVDGHTTGLSGGYDIISLRTTGDASASSFGNDRQRHYRDATGGQRLAEVIIYEEALSDSEILSVEAYLHAKWGIPSAARAGMSTDTDPTASQMCLMLRNGSILDLNAGDYTLGAVGGIGSVTEGTLTVSGLHQIAAEQPGDELTLAGSLTLAAGVDWTLATGPAGIAPVIAAGGITFQGGGTLTITDAAALPNDSILLLLGAAVNGFNPAVWNVIADDSRQYALKAIDNDVYLLPSAKGTLFILR